MKRFIACFHLFYFVICFHFNEAIQLLNVFQKSRNSFRDQINRLPEVNPYGGLPGRVGLWNRLSVPIIQSSDQSYSAPGTIEPSNGNVFNSEMDFNRNFNNFRNIPINEIRDNFGGLDSISSEFNNNFRLTNGYPERDSSFGARVASYGNYPNERCFTLTELAGLLDQSQFNEQESEQFVDFNK